jgi:hypothetical protein
LHHLSGKHAQFTNKSVPSLPFDALTLRFSARLEGSSMNNVDHSSATISCSPCAVGSFCPPGSIVELNRSILRSTSQAFAYPSSTFGSSFDDILMGNTFNLQISPRRCLLISPFFWSLVALAVAMIFLIVMGGLYYSPTGMNYFHRLECIFRHSDLIGNGELWFGGLVSFAMIVLIVYSFLFGYLFLGKYPIEASTDASFACDTQLRNAQFSSNLQLLTTIRTDEEAIIFQLLDAQPLTMTIDFIQTGFQCEHVAAQVVHRRSISRRTCLAHNESTRSCFRLSAETDRHVLGQCHYQSMHRPVGQGDAQCFLRHSRTSDGHPIESDR